MPILLTTPMTLPEDLHLNDTQLCNPHIFSGMFHVSSFSQQTAVAETHDDLIFINIIIIIHRTVRSRAMLLQLYSLLCANQDANPSLVFLANPLMTRLWKLLGLHLSLAKWGLGYLQPERTFRVTCSMQHAVSSQQSAFIPCSLMKKHRASSTCEEPKGTRVQGQGQGQGQGHCTYTKPVLPHSAACMHSASALRQL